MPLYSYTARNQDGNLIKGTTDAMSLATAKSALEEMNLVPEEIHEATPSEKNQPKEAPPYSIEKRLQEEVGGIAKVEDTGEQDELNLGEKAEPQSIYFPIVDTLRLYAGWLLAGYFVAFALGLYQLTKPLPFEVPYVLAFLYSPLILSFALAAFLFLLATSIHKRIHGGKLSGFLLTIVAVGVFVVYRANT